MMVASAPVQLQIDWMSLWFKMGWLDIVFLAAFIIGVIFGLHRGLARVLPRLVGVLVAQVVTVEYSKALAEAMTARLQVPTFILHAVFFVSLAIASLFLVRILFQLLEVFATVDFKPPLNGVGGAILNGMCLVFFLSLISSFVMLIPLPFVQHTFTDRSLSGPFLIELSGRVHHFFIRFLPDTWLVT